MNVSRLNKFTSNVTCGTNNINHKLNYDDNCLIYLLSFQYCSKQSLESFVKKVACKSVALPFQQHQRQCLLKNVTISLSNKTNGKNLKRDRSAGGKVLKLTHLLDIMLTKEFGHSLQQIFIIIVITVIIFLFIHYSFLAIA